MLETGRLSRRGLLQAAGGITFLAIAPGAAAKAPLGLESETFDSLAGAPARPVFTALPYLQPGPAGHRLVDGEESLVIAWQTDVVPARFELTYGLNGTEHRATIEQAPRGAGIHRASERRTNYVARLQGLNLHTRYKYRVDMNGERVVEGYFTTRKPRGEKVRFVSFGDNSHGDMSDRAIAYQAFRARPDFVMNTGDTVYDSGLDNEYSRHFFPIYNADEAGSRIGAPLLRAVPFYTVLGNHDITSRDAKGHPVSDLDHYPDACGYFTNMHLPLNGPEPSHPMPIVGAADRLAEFKAAAGKQHLRKSNYSFDYGDGHFLCLDSNVYVDPTDPALQKWIADDLSGSSAVWKIVVYHHPAFNVGNEHYDEQHMRVLSPIFEKYGVDVVLSGHEHTYQRTRPLRFTPRDESGAKAVGEGTRYVSGSFTVDRRFDGQTATKPDGVLYITTGAGGKSLYDPEMNDDPTRRLHPEDGNVEYIAAMVTDRHSLSVIDMDSRSFILRQIDEWGQQIDRVELRKG